MSADKPYAATSSGLALAVKLAPKSKRTRIEGVAEDGDGGAMLKVSVTAAPEAGKANAALVALLAKEWRLPKSSISVSRGVASRRKIVAIEGDATALMAMLDGWFAARK